MADNEFRHPAPPNYRNARPGRTVTRLHVGPPAEGKHVKNMSVPPLVHTNGKGERPLLELDRPDNVSAPALNPQTD